jgi:hypothetical protein
MKPRHYRPISAGNKAVSTSRLARGAVLASWIPWLIVIGLVIGIWIAALRGCHQFSQNV